jgi:hypothetical protein
MKKLTPETRYTIIYSDKEERTILCKSTTLAKAIARLHADGRGWGIL